MFINVYVWYIDKKKLHNNFDNQGVIYVHINGECLSLHSHTHL